MFLSITAATCDHWPGGSASWQAELVHPHNQSQAVARIGIEQQTVALSGCHFVDNASSAARQLLRFHPSLDGDPVGKLASHKVSQVGADREFTADQCLQIAGEWL